MIRPWAPDRGGLRIAVRLTPRSSRDALEGIATLSDGRTTLQARVRAVPEDGCANDSLVRLIASTLDVPRSRVAIVEGATSRLKGLRVVGDPDALAARLDALLTP